MLHEHTHDVVSNVLISLFWKPDFPSLFNTLVISFPQFSKFASRMRPELSLPARALGCYGLMGEESRDFGLDEGSQFKMKIRILSLMIGCVVRVTGLWLFAGFRSGIILIL